MRINVSAELATPRHKKLVKCFPTYFMLIVLRHNNKARLKI